MNQTAKESMNETANRSMNVTAKTSINETAKRTMNEKAQKSKNDNTNPKWLALNGQPGREALGTGGRAQSTGKPFFGGWKG